MVLERDMEAAERAKRKKMLAEVYESEIERQASQRQLERMED